MEITVAGRHMDVPERFRRHLDEKLEKITQLAPGAQRVDVEVSHESNPRQSGQCDRVELTVHEAGAIIRSEARADDLYAALDVAYGKLLERLRRARDRRKDHRRGRVKAHGQAPSVRTMEPVLETPAEPAETTGDGTAAGDTAERDDRDPARRIAATGESPVVIRRKRHSATPMSIDEALERMELVGHDFFLFVDTESARPTVVYRRKGWDYGVIELDAVSTD